MNFASKMAAITVISYIEAIGAPESSTVVLGTAAAAVEVVVV